MNRANTNSDMNMATPRTESKSGTLKDWRLPNSDEKFDDEKYLADLKEYAKKATVVFARVISRLP